MKLQNVEDIYILSPMQKGMIFHSIYAPTSSVYIEQFVCTVAGDLNRQTFQQAWQRVVERQPVLRTLFLWEGLAEPLQVVKEQVVLPWQNADWRDLNALEQQAQLENFLQNDRKRGFDLNQAPLLRCFLAQCDANAHYFVLSNHHAILDGWSLSPLLREVFVFYESFCTGVAVELAPPRPFRDYIKWLDKQDAIKAEAFWRKTLRGFKTPTDLPVGHRVTFTHDLPEQVDGVGPVILSPQVTTLIQTIARQYGLTINSVVQGAWALLLSRYTGEDDVLFGATTSGRPTELTGVDSMIGIFINTLPVRVRIAPEQVIGPWLQKLQKQQAEQRQYEYTPLTSIQQWSELSQDQALFESILVFENHASNLSAREGTLIVRDVRGIEQTNYPLTVSAWQVPELSFKIDYDSRRFGAEAMQRMAGHLQILLEQMGSQSGQKLADLPMLAKDEEAQLTRWNQTQMTYDKTCCIHQLFEAQAAQTPEAMALFFEGKGTSVQANVYTPVITLTYRDLNEYANQVAHYLRTLGVGPSTLVGISIERSPEMIVGLLAILKSGGAYVSLDPNYSDERLNSILADTQPSIVVTVERFASHLSESVLQLVCLDSDQHEISRYAKENPDCRSGADDLAYILFTSGSMGRPKGIMTTHRSVVSFAQSAVKLYDLTPTDRVLQSASINFDTSVEEIFPCLISGGVVVLKTDDMLHSISHFFQKCRKWNLTVLDLTTAFWHELVHELSRGELSLPHALRLVIIGGEEALAEQVEQWRMIVGSTPRLINTYGPTETTVITSSCDLSVYQDNGTTVPIGKPIPNAQVHVLDKTLKRVPIGVSGELYIGGTGIAQGYWKRPDLTAEHFIPSPFGLGERLYKSGDLVRWLPDGNLTFLGRYDNQVKIRGNRIELGEIESVLHQHPSVREVVVLAQTDPSGNSQTLVAYVVPQDESLKVATLSRHIRTKLPDYMVPSAYITLDELPFTPNGKVDRRALPEAKAADKMTQTEYMPPRDPIELKLATIWQRILQVPSIGRDDNFFELGGHSLLAMQLMSEVEKDFEQSLPLSILMQQGTIADMADLIRQDIGFLPDATLVGLQPNGTRRPFFCVHPAGGNVVCYTDLARCLGEDRPFYGLQDLGLLPSHQSLESIEEMATHYIREIRKAQTEGPYLLGGWSMGGIVAFEMAQQLRQSGHEIALLAILDAPAPHLDTDNPLTTIWHQARQWFRKMASFVQHGSGPNVNAMASVIQEVGRSLRKEIVIAPEQLRSLRPDAIIDYLITEFERAGETLSKEQLTAIFEYAQRYAVVNAANIKALHRYRPRLYSGQITLFRIHEVDPQHQREDPIYGDEAYGWTTLSTEEVALHYVPGEHRDMVYDPHAPALAEKLGAAIDVASEISTSTANERQFNQLSQGIKL